MTSVRNPAGWVTKAAEQEEKARRGEEWRSEAYVVFCLVHFWIWNDAEFRCYRFTIIDGEERAKVRA